MRFVSYGTFNSMVYATAAQQLGASIDLQIGVAFLGILEAAIAAENKEAPLLQGRCFLPVLCLDSKVQGVISGAKEGWRRQLRKILVFTILWSASLLMGTHLILDWIRG